MAIKNVVSYLRVSTQRQGRSGLGLDAQRSAAASYCAANGYTLTRSFVEIETARDDDRPVLAEALAFARRAKATLLVANISRLSRRVSFVSAMMESGVPFLACDVPGASNLTLHVLAAVAEAEAKSISDRTRLALAERRSAACSWARITPLSPASVKQHVVQDN
jgi:DNA invertase Pin-like site-specific DNA recombinase